MNGARISACWCSWEATADAEASVVRVASAASGVSLLEGVAGAVSDVGVGAASVEGVMVLPSRLATSFCWIDKADMGVVIAWLESEDEGIIDGFSAWVMTENGTETLALLCCTSPRGGMGM